MKFLYVILTALIILAPIAAYAIIPQTFKASGSGTVRYLGFIKVYDATLYVPEQVSQQNLLDGRSSRCLQLKYNVDLKAEDFIKAAETILQEQHGEETLSRLKPQIDLLHQNYKPVKEGDSYTLCYDGLSQETKLVLNEEVLVTIQSTEFAEIYFGIWLGDKNPLSDDLRRNLIKGLPKDA